MTLRHFKVFVAVCEEKSITAAANKLYISQPAVSITIKEMEDYYNVPLFDRISRKLYITAFGEEIYQYASRIINLCSELDLSLGAKKFENTLRVGCGIAFGKMCMPEIAHRYKTRYPHEKLIVTVNSSEIVEPMIQMGELDIAIMEGTLKSNDFHREVLEQNQVVAFCHRDHPLAQKKIVTASDLVQHNLLMRERFSPTREAVNTFFLNNNLVATPIWESISVLSLINAVKLNVGISFLPINHLIPWKDDSITILNVKDMNIQRFINIVYKKEKILTHSMENFVCVCKTYTEEHKTAI